MTNDNDSREAVAVWACANDLAIAQAAEIERLKAERAVLVEALEGVKAFMEYRFSAIALERGEPVGIAYKNVCDALGRAALAKAGGAQ